MIMFPAILVFSLRTCPMFAFNFPEATMKMLLYLFFPILFLLEIILHQSGRKTPDICVLGDWNLPVGCFGTHPCPNLRTGWWQLTKWLALIFYLCFRMYSLSSIDGFSLFGVFTIYFFYCFSFLIGKPRNYFT